MNEQALPDLGLPSDRMLEAEVALRLAAFLLSLPRSGSIASVAIDGGSLKVRDVILFDIAQFMMGTGWEQVKEPQVGRNACTGTYRRGNKTIRVHSRAGGGDVVARVDGRRIIAACQKGPLVRRTGGPESPLLTLALGQALLFDVDTNDIVVVAVPDTPAFHRLAVTWRERPLLKRAGIQLALVHRNGAVFGLDMERSVTADSCLRHKLVQLLCFGRAAGTLAFAGEDRNVDELPVPVAPTGALARWRSTADGAVQVIRDDVAALAPSQLEQFGPVAWIRFIGGLCQVRAGQCKAPRFSKAANLGS